MFIDKDDTKRLNVLIEIAHSTIHDLAECCDEKELANFIELIYDYGFFAGRKEASE